VPLVIVLIFAACPAFAQTTSRSSSPRVSSPIWELPAWYLLEGDPKPTVPKEMLAALRISDFPISLESTPIEDVRTTLGGTIGRRGDGGGFVEWLCFHGKDPSGQWVLWLDGGEINGGTVGGFQWQRVDKGAVFDPRCRRLGDAQVELPITLRLGIGEAELRKNLGRPTVTHGDRLIYIHEHQEAIQGEPFTSNNTVGIVLRAGKVWAIEAAKTTTN
jgi:hypothetical protein